ncbi:GNAT family N-acetyltransferase [Enterobacter sp. ENT03]|uniref:GNAT family N-acetyltransferase n=1 Tax=Enterobacter sp. ENT03 TaxID=2854780 RepID=UPI001C45C802|nr:GNAT family N-acetyltransferase [Enterobacter sp. ENT03]MBV7403446.1 GNAT family N-acetyltransferase [Enterobacter sp. ENT03]
MITFTPMSDAEYPAFLAYFIPDYAQEIAENYRLTDDAALRHATAEVNASLHAGVNTPGQTLLTIVHAPDGAVGYLWYKADPLLKSVYVNDLSIFPHLRNQGLGRLALAELEHKLRDEGYQQIKLRVAAENKTAQHVYAASGFNVTGINMNKLLSPD